MTKLRNTELRILRGTGSPSGRYAVAWGVPGVPKLDVFRSVDRPYDRVRNYLVEKRTQNIVGIIPLHTRTAKNVQNGHWYRYKAGGDDWHFWGDRGRSHSELHTFWNAAEDWAVVLHSGKWWHHAIYLCHCPGETFHLVEIGDQIEDLIRDYLLRTRRTAYLKAQRDDERDPAVDVNIWNGNPRAIRIAPPRIMFEILAGIPKALNDPLALSATLEMTIERGKHGPIVIPGRLHRHR